MVKCQIIETCLKCGYKWIRQVLKPKRCPDCRSTCWNKISIAKSRSTGLKIDIPAGESRIYPVDKKTKIAIASAKKKNPWLVVDVRCDVIIVRNGKP